MVPCFVIGELGHAILHWQSIVEQRALQLLDDLALRCLYHARVKQLLLQHADGFLVFRLGFIKLGCKVVEIALPLAEKLAPRVLCVQI